MAVLAFRVGLVVVVGGLIWRIWRMQRQVKALQAQMEAMSEAEEIVARVAKRRRLGVVRGGKLTALAGGVVALRPRHMTAAGAGLAAGAITLASMSTPDLSTPVAPEAEVVGPPPSLYESDPIEPDPPVATTDPADVHSPTSTTAPARSQKDGGDAEVELAVATTIALGVVETTTTLPVGIGLDAQGEDESGRPVAEPTDPAATLRRLLLLSEGLEALADAG